MPRKGESALPSDRDRLEHMLQAAREAIEFSNGRTREDLDRDRMFHHALVRCIEIIGEAAARTSDAGRDRASGIPWGSIVQMRHIFAHAYFSVSGDEVWHVVEKDLTPLIAALESTLKDWPEGAC